MIIDLILDRKDGKEYDPRKFYSDVLKYEDWLRNYDISSAMDYGTERDVKRAICDYIRRNGYNTDICNYVNSVKWLTPVKASKNKRVGEFIIEDVGGFVAIYPANCKDKAKEIKTIFA